VRTHIDAAVRVVVTSLATFTLAGLLASQQASAAPSIFACAPEWAALARVIAPDAQIFSATHARQDPHDIEARPALISALRRADLAICTGAGLEAGWFPMLQNRAGNARVMPGAPGMLIAADGLPLLDDAHHHPARDKGHVHAAGNPHFQLDPRLLARVANRITERLAAIDPTGAADYQARLARWLAEWNKRIEGWQVAAKPLFGEALIAEHSSFAYLFRWLELYQAADLEPVPGVPPTLSHLQGLLQRARDDPPMAVAQTLYQDPQSGRWLAEKLSVPLLTLPSTVTSDGNTRSLEGLFDHLVRSLLAAREQRRPPR
jgi:zinc/manganese transport system substrate-binding protein